MVSRTALVVLVLIGLVIGSCAKKAEDVPAAYVSPLTYQPYNCQQLAGEAERVSQRAAELSGVQNKKRTRDTVTTTAAVIVFWPAAFLVNGDDAQTAELARLKGEFQTIQQVSVQKNCGLQFQQG
ncbi:hypothetical protein A7A08_02933 [Methyloligella halotolerans]|uniref:Lipoprotein n=1 Tax=Methyloligella halotolerans TaxID=1177755 RepID=A0A1E2RVK8_9HYPH|nr:hypothetical protein [Methyloligella halotolerans]ODA66286.1 hypothetical protein A7A08_02933 [Methyloligella halotolerans]